MEVVEVMVEQSSMVAVFVQLGFFVLLLLLLVVEALLSDRSGPSISQFLQLGFFVGWERAKIVAFADVAVFVLFAWVVAAAVIFGLITSWVGFCHYNMPI